MIHDYCRLAMESKNSISEIAFAGCYQFVMSQHLQLRLVDLIVANSGSNTVSWLDSGA